MKSLLRTIRTISVVGTAALLLTSGPLIAGNSLHNVAPLVAAAVGNCSPNKLKFKVSTSVASTSSTIFQDVPETTLHFSQGGTTPSCVIVAFSAEASTAANTAMVVEAVLDGATICLPNDNIFVNNEGLLSTHAMNYVCPNVAPGQHSIKMHFRNKLGGGFVAFNFRTTIVQFVSP